MSFQMTQLIGFGTSTVLSVAGSAVTTTPVGSANLTINLPTGIGAGDLLIVFLSIDANGRIQNSVPTGFTRIGSVVNQSAVGELAAFYKVATGAEGATVAMTMTGGSSSGGTVALRIVGQQGNPESAATSTLDPASLTPSWGAVGTLWIPCLGLGSTGSVSSVTFPANYTVNNASNADFHANVAWRIASAASEDPAAFVATGGAPNAGTMTIGVRPA